ncbi:hypothetical protein M569_14042, partial [Genlisea aurea]
NELLFAEIEYMQKREIDLHHSNQFLRAKIAETERVHHHHQQQQQQQMNLIPPEYDLIHHSQPYDAARDYLQING